MANSNPGQTPQNTKGGTTISFGNTPQAVDDNLASTLTGLTEESRTVVYLDVMGNDLGGNAKSLWSVDNGVNNTGAMNGYVAGDLLTQDTARTGALSSDTSLNGAKIWITSDGKVGYDTTTLSANFAASLQSLAAGEHLTDSFIYAIRLANGTLSWANATVDFAGVNDAPVIGQGPQSGAVKEDQTLTASGQFSATDPDHNATQAWSVQGPADGAYGAIAVDASTGKWTYALNNAAHQDLAQGESHDETFTIRVTDDQGAHADQTVTVTVSGTNDAPVVANAPADAAGAVKEDTTLVAAGQLAASDVDHGATQAWSVQGPADGAYGAIAVDASTGKWTYALTNGSAAVQALAAGESHDESFTIRVTDDKGASADQTVAVTVQGTNDAPVVSAADVTGAVTEAITPVGNLTDSGAIAFSDVDLRDVHSVSAVTAPADARGALTAAVTSDTTGSGSGGVVTWNYSVPAAAIEGLYEGQQKVETFSFDVMDDQGASVTRSVSVTLTGTNDAPVAVGDVLQAVEDTPVTFSSGYLLGNDTDVDNLNTQLSIASVTSGTGGTAVLNANGTVTFTPNANFNGAASFSYKATDGLAQSNAAAVTVNVAPVNDPPVGVDDANALTVTSLASQVHTSTVNWVDWTSNSPGQVTGTINVGNGQTIGVTYTGEYAFAQTNGGTGYYTTPPAQPGDYTLGTGTYTSAAVANGPTGSDIIALSQATQKTLTFSQPVDNLFFAVVSLNGNGYLFDQNFDIMSYGRGYWGDGYATKVALADGRYEVVGNKELHGVLRVDGTVQSLTWTSQTPEYWNGFTVGTYGKALTANVSGNVLANDSDPESDPISVSAVNGQQIVGNSITLTLPSGARVNVNRDGSYLYDENGAFGSLAQGQTKPDSFQYTVSDSHGAVDTANVTIAVTGINDAPVAVDDSVSTNEDAPLTIPQASLLANDTDVDAGDSKAFVGLGSGAQHGSVAISGANVVYTPAANYNGADSFSYTMKDAAGATSTATVNVSVNPVNDGPAIQFAPVSLVTNGGFEQPGGAGAVIGTYAGGSTSVTGWTVTGGDIDYIGSLWQAADGTHSLDLNGFNPGGVQQTNIATVPGREYTVTFGLSKNFANAGSVTLQVSAAGDSTTYTYSDITSSGDMRWHGQIFTFTATGPSTTLSFASTSPGASGPALDGVSITQTVTAEDTPTVITGLSVSDPDSGSDPILMSLGVGHGALGLLSAAGLSMVDDNGSDGTLSFTGSQSAINAALASGVKYTPSPDYNGTESLVATVDDQGHNGTGGPLSATQTVSMKVGATNPRPISEWTANGNANDSVAPANNGTLVNGVGFAAGRNGGQAFSFDGFNDYVAVTREIQNDFTITGWLKTSAASLGGSQFFQGNGLVYADVGDVNNDFGVSVLNNKLAFGTGNPDLTIQSNTNVVTGNWIQFAAVRSGDLISIYVNGTLESSMHTGNGGALNAPAAITFGGNTVDGRYYQGLLDDVAFYNYAVSPLDLVGIAQTSPV